MAATGMAAIGDVLTLDGDVAAQEGAGLLSVPERYRFQFLLLAAGRLPRSGEARIARTAGRLAEALEIPPGLADDGTGALDAWFREHAAEIAKRADAMTRWPRFAARVRRSAARALRLGRR